ncbi:protein BPS1, chloroplastic-like isoform X2 [Salvia miltiorrhiza]|nr:protein BPS1, chloroplastic-like isoform X2 [Salvia miltiorrhiza]
MSRPQDPHRGFLPFGNPFRMMLPKGSSLSPKMLDLLNAFEESMAEKLRKLKPPGKEDVLCLTWMKSAMELLCEIHADIKVLITALELPVCDWDDKWIDVYLDNSVKLLDICIALSSEISRLKQGHLFLRCLLHDLESASPKQFIQARSSLDGWRQHMGSKNPRLDNIFSVMDSLAQTLDLPKIKNSSKGKVLMRAMYGVKVVTLFICSVFAAAFSGSATKLMDLPVPETCLWAQAFSDLQTHVNNEIRNTNPDKDKDKILVFLKEVVAVESGVRKVYPIVQDGVESPVEAQVLQKSKLGLEKAAGELCQGLELVAKEVDGFFRVVLTGRDALLSNLRLVGNVFEQGETSIQGPAVR